MFSQREKNILSQSLPIHGILLLGGRGTRMRTVTNTNKNLLVVGKKQMFEHGIEFLMHSGIYDITLVVNPKDEPIYRNMLEQNQWDIEINFVVQEQPLGTSHAVGLCASCIRHPHIATLWGDNLFEYTLHNSCKDFVDKGDLCKIHITTVHNPQDFGVILLEGDRIISIEDKPQQPKANTICTGFMLFTDSVFDEIDHVVPNHKQERDIMDIIRYYLRIGKLTYAHISGCWFDAGTNPETYYRAAFFAETFGLNKTFITKDVKQK